MITPPADPGVNTFMGRPLSQDWRDLEVWEKFFNLHPVKCVIELGTGNGSMSLFLAAQAVRAGAEFHTFDNQLFHGFGDGFATRLPINFYHMDLHGVGATKLRAILARDDIHPCVLFCDDGDKPWEWREFGKDLRAGDYIAVHDWPYEFGPQHLGALPVTPLFAEWCAQRGSITRWYRREAGTA